MKPYRMSKAIELTRRHAILLGAACIAASPALSVAAADGVLQKGLSSLERLIGRWSGKGEGQPGVSQVERTYEAVLGGQFLMVRNRSTYRPQQRNPDGETHDELGLYSFDNARARIVFRQFHVEGFVNQYAAVVDTPEAIVFESEMIENIPAGWRARETYRFPAVDTFEEIFELAEPGMEFAPYSRCQLSRGAPSKFCPS